jgi:hypothetical protein
MSLKRQPTAFYTLEGQGNVIIHNGDVAETGLYTGRKDSAFDGAIPRTAFSGDGTFTYTGALGTFVGVKMKHQH